ncbi:hypothetical protein QYM36_015512 [Artemia franciscana]|uniref:Anti-proliferative protein domain-containing protein n=2 Tax=Artemia franciscana TaxID=6661 RepID=A0AA88HN03_ARTSF|nr:hypothetical protein QYM36_015512 [Artemia franciscana]
MQEEVSAAVLFLTRIIEKRGRITQSVIEKFGERLSELLKHRFKDHWFPEQPSKGQGYRCIRLNESDPRDPTIERAAVECGLSYNDLGLPVEMTLWVDPKEVCCRFGEHKGSYCTVASFQSSTKEGKSIPIESVVDKAVQDLIDASEISFPSNAQKDSTSITNEVKSEIGKSGKENVEPTGNPSVNVESSPKRRNPRKHPPNNRPVYPFNNRHPFQPFPNYGPSGLFGPKSRNFFGSYPPPGAWFPPMTSPPGAASPPPHFLYPGLSSPTSYPRKRNTYHNSYNNRPWMTKPTMVKA